MIHIPSFFFPSLGVLNKDLVSPEAARDFPFLSSRHFPLSFHIIIPNTPPMLQHKRPGQGRSLVSLSHPPQLSGSVFFLSFAILLINCPIHFYN